MYIQSYDGTKVHYILKRGKRKTTLVFLHGWANNWTSWRKSVNYFQKKGYTTLAVDLRGHGKSDIPRQVFQYRLSCFAKDLHLLFKKEDLKNVVLIGHSMGGMIAITYYGMFRKNVSGLVIASSTYKKVMKEKFIGALSPFLQRVLKAIAKYQMKEKKTKKLKEPDFSKYTEKMYPLLIKEAYVHTSLISMFGCLEAMMEYNATHILPTITAPTLILYGKYEFVFPKEVAEYMHRHIAGSEVHTIDKGLHFAHLTNAKETNKYIESFLDKHGF